METKFINSDNRDVTSREAYDFFKKHKTKNSKFYDEYKKWIRIITGLLNTVTLAEREAKYGVYIKGLGYFCRIPIRKIRGRRISVVRRGEGSTIYIRIFIPDQELQGYAYREQKTNRREFEPNFDLVQIYRELVETQDKMRRSIRRLGANKHKNNF